MMKIKQLSVVLSLILLLGFVPSGVTSSTLDTNHDPALTIYTYSSLLADPGYAFDRAFEQYAGLANNSVEVVLLDDAGSLVTRAASEKSDPVADVLIGIDNALVSQARQQDILTPYEPTGTENLVDGLVDGLASDFLLTPYDYGVISLWHLNTTFTETFDSSNFDLENLLEDDFKDQLILENPQLSSPGLGFLLSTIAMYGDDAGVEGLLEGDWNDFWRQLSEPGAGDSRAPALTSSWGDAIELLYTEEANRSMMVSYTTSPAYGACLFDDYSTTAVLPSIDGTTYGWQQIEGLGLVKNAQNPDLAKDFIDWFISDELQSQIHQNQWVYPAHKDIVAPDCYDAAIDPSTITPLNDRFDQSVLDDNLDSWLQEWELAWVEGVVDSDDKLSFNPLFLLGALVMLPVLRRKLN